MKVNIKCLSGNILKILAAIFMVIDHAGILFFPREIIFRIIGRLALPIFAFMIAEGARYTRNKVRYILTIGGLAFLCQLGYYIFAKDLYMCILVTFTLAIAMIYALGFFKKCLFSDKVGIAGKIFSALPFIATVILVYFLNTKIQIDYGFYGCMLPVFASLFDFRGIELPKKAEWLDSVYLRISALAIGLILLAASYGSIAWYSLLAIPLLLLYSEKRGKANLKYFFYIFYPVHLVVLEGIYILIRYLK